MGKLIFHNPLESTTDGPVPDDHTAILFYIINVILYFH